MVKIIYKALKEIIINGEKYEKGEDIPKLDKKIDSRKINILIEMRRVEKVVIEKEKKKKEGD